MAKSDQETGVRPSQSASGPVLPQGLEAQLRILATTDLHMHLTSFDYYADRPDATVGLTRTATLISKARAEAARSNITTLLLDNGDSLQGTPMGEVAVAEVSTPHPAMQAFDYLGYDAKGLGNHDFNFGLDALDRVLAQSTGPVVCSNVVRRDRIDRTQPTAILERYLHAAGGRWPIRIGILSVIPTQTALWDAHLLGDQVEIGDMIESARHHAKRLRQGGCDLIIALAHTGLGAVKASPDMENAVIPLAAIDEIDVVIAGHTHLHLPGPDHAGMDCVDCERGTVHGTPTIMAGSAGSHLGVIDLDLKTNLQTGWQITGHQSMLRPIASHCADGRLDTPVAEDQKLIDLLAPHHQATREHMGQHVGTSDQSLHSYFTFFAPDRGLALVAAAQAAALRPLLAETEAAALPLLSAAAPGKFGGRSGPLCFTDVPAGRLSLRHVADLYIFPNTLQAVIMTGAQMLDWLESAASLFCQIRPGSRDTMLVDPAMAGYYFDVLHGMQYKIDLKIPARFWPDGRMRNETAHRIVSATYQGAAIRPEQKFIVALNNYRAGAGGNVAALKNANRVLLPRLSIRDALCRYVSAPVQDDPLSMAPPAWTFAPVPGASAVTLTGPGAMAHLAELDGRGVVALGMEANGFLKLRLPL